MVTAIALHTLLSTAALAGEAPPPSPPWRIHSDAQFHKRMHVQFALYGAFAAGFVVSAAAGESDSDLAFALSNGGFAFGMVGLTAAGLHLPTLSAYGWRTRRFAWTHPVAVIGAVPLTAAGVATVAWVLQPNLDEGTAVGLGFVAALGLFGAFFTHVPAAVGVIALHMDPRLHVSAALLPPARREHSLRPVPTVVARRAW